MLLLFAHLVSLNPEWSKAEITVKTVSSNAMTFEQTKRRLSELVARCRIKATSEVVERSPGATVREIIQDESRSADLVFLGLRTPEVGGESDYAERLLELVGDLPTVILVRAAGPFAGQLL